MRKQSVWARTNLRYVFVKLKVLKRHDEKCELGNVSTIGNMCMWTDSVGHKQCGDCTYLVTKAWCLFWGNPGNTIRTELKPEA